MGAHSEADLSALSREEKHPGRRQTWIVTYSMKWSKPAECGSGEWRGPWTERKACEKAQRDSEGDILKISCCVVWGHRQSRRGRVASMRLATEAGSCIMKKFVILLRSYALSSGQLGSTGRS